MIDNVEQLKEHIANYFFSIFSSTTGQNNEEVLRVIQPRVTSQMNEILCSEYSEEEVKNALDSIGDLKAPGPDGMPAVFFKKFWSIVGDQVTKEVLHVLRGGRHSRRLEQYDNCTYPKFCSSGKFEGSAAHKPLQCGLQADSKGTHQ